MDVSGALRKLARMEQVASQLESSLPGLMAAEAERMGRSALHRSVYGTTPARVYVRTGRLKREFSVRPAGAGFIRIMSAAVYASNVERMPLSGLAFDSATGQASGLGGWQPVNSEPPYFGRSGVMGWLPGPHVAPAALRSLFVARAETLKRLRAVGK